MWKSASIKQGCRNLWGVVFRVFRQPEQSKDRVQSTTFLLKISDLEVEKLWNVLQTTHQGLTSDEVQKRIQEYGHNTIVQEQYLKWYWVLLNNFQNPFILVLLLLGILSYITEDMTGTLVVLTMIIISVLMRFIQEYRSSRAAEALRMMVQTKAMVKRIFLDEQTGAQIEVKKEIPIEALVPGDVVNVSAGDMIPADIRLIQSKDLFISQAALTGESIPVEKGDIGFSTKEIVKTDPMNPFDRNNLCFMGTSVVSGFGEAVVVATGKQTLFGSLVKNVVGYRAETNFDRGINSVTWILIRAIVAIVPLIFIINGLDKGDWKEAFLFSIAVAVGLTPEMLPMVVTTNLAKGAVAMSRFKVIVKRLNSIQNFGAMDILCTDKTGTLTQDKIILEKYLDIEGQEDLQVLEFGFLNSYYQSGLKNMLDRAVLEHANIRKKLNLQENYKKIDEIPFDFTRKRLSVVVQRETEDHLMICKGSLDGLLGISHHVHHAGEIVPMNEIYRHKIIETHDQFSRDGLRVIAVGYKTLPLTNKAYSKEDEQAIIFLGFMTFLDPPKETASAAIEMLNQYGVKVKVLTGDNDIITKRICKEVNLPFDHVLLGSEIESMSDAELSNVVETTNVFAKLTPLQKSKILTLLKRNGHVVGFLGDGINDAAALRESDVGVSVDTATDIARESADIILLEKSLLVLVEGVIKGREVYGNIVKYIKMTTSSNFGNVLSVLVSSIFLPFLPMMPLQLLVQNLLYDFSQLSIPWDKMDKEFLATPKTWDPRGMILFMVCLGPISSIFDMVIFWILWNVYGANTSEHQSLFQTGWFVEGLLSQTLIVHMIRTRKIPFIQSNATFPVLVTTALIAGIGLYLPFSKLGGGIQLMPLPDSYFAWLLLIILAYCAAIQLVKFIYIKRFNRWL